MTRVRVPDPGAEPPLGEGGRVGVVLDPDRDGEPVARCGPAMSTLSSGRFVARKATPVTGSRFIGTPTPTRGAPSRSRLRDETVDLGEDRLARAVRASAPRSSGRSCRRARRCPARIFVPPRSTPIDRVRRHQAATIPGLMATDGKPYRVYKGGRSKGRVPLQRPPLRAQSGAPPPARREARPPPLPTPATPDAAVDRARARAPVGVLVAAWGVLSVPRRLDAASARRTTRVPGRRPAQLAEGDGLLVSSPDDAARPRHGRRRRAGREGRRAPTRSCSSAPTPGASGSRTSRSHATSRSRSRTTASRRSTPRHRSAARRSRSAR